MHATCARQTYMGNDLTVTDIVKSIREKKDAFNACGWDKLLSALITQVTKVQYMQQIGSI